MSARHLEAALADLSLSYSQSLAKAQQAIGRIVSKTLFVLLLARELVRSVACSAGPTGKTQSQEPSAASV